VRRAPTIGSQARELILLFVAFELISIPLYFLTGVGCRPRVKLTSGCSPRRKGALRDNVATPMM